MCYHISIKSDVKYLHCSLLEQMWKEYHAFAILVTCLMSNGDLTFENIMCSLLEQMGNEKKKNIKVSYF